MIKSWFLDEDAQTNHETERLLERCLVLYRFSLCKYFGLEHEQVKSIHHMVQSLNQKEMSKGDQLFVEFIKVDER